MDKKRTVSHDASGVLEEADGFLFVRKRAKRSKRELSEETVNLAENEDGRRSSRRKTATLRAQRPGTMNGLRSHPHMNVGIESMFRHISEKLSDPMRLKQLWIWLVQRQLDTCFEDDGKFASLSDSQQAVVQKVLEKLHQSLLDNKVNMSWFARDPSNPPDPVNQGVMLPNKANENNQRRLERFSRELQRWSQEEREWKELLASVQSTPPLALPKSTAEPPLEEGALNAQSWHEALKLLNLELGRLKALSNAARANVQGKLDRAEKLMEQISLKLQLRKASTPKTDTHSLLLELSKCTTII